MRFPSIFERLSFASCACLLKPLPQPPSSLSLSILVAYSSRYPPLVPLLHLLLQALDDRRVYR